MHPALHVDELVRLIVQHCDDLPYKEHQLTLFNLSLTCKSLLEPALDSLWSRLPSVIPLMSLLPGLYVRDGKYTTERFLTAPEKHRFEHYAVRVKDISQHTRFAIDNDISDILPFFATGTSFLILPNLSSASLAFSATSSGTCCLPVSPAMTQLRVRIDSSPDSSAAADTLQRYLTTAQSIAHNLDSVNFRGKLSQDTNILIASMSSLKSVSFSTGHSLTAHTFTAIGNFPALRTLNIRIDHLSLVDLPDPSDPLTNTSPIFPALEDLTVHAQASVMSYLLTRLQPGSLKSISITIAGDMVSSSNHVQHPDWHELLPLLATTASPRLHTLRIDHPSSHLEHLNPLLPTDCLTYDLLRHFVEFGHLEELSLQLGLPVFLNDSDFARIAPKWPSLRCFRLETLSSFLDGEYDWTWVNPATPTALAHIAAHMPQLEELNVAIDAGCKKQVRTNPIRPSGKLRYLHLASGPPCAEPEVLAKFIHSIFPMLEDVDYEGRHEDAWQVINDTLQAIR